MTGVGNRLHWGFTVSSFLFLLIVLFQSLAGDFFSSITISLAAVGCLDYFFVDPLYSFTIAKRMDAVALLAFLSTALVVTRLVLRVEAKAESAARQREQLDRLYRLSQRLLALKPLPAVGTEFLEPFQGMFGSTAVCLFDADTAELHSIGHSREGLPKKLATLTFPIRTGTTRPRYFGAPPASGRPDYRRDRIRRPGTSGGDQRSFGRARRHASGKDARVA